MKKQIVMTFTKAEIQHLLMCLDDSVFLKKMLYEHGERQGSGWWAGNKAQFEKRHIALMVKLENCH